MTSHTAPAYGAVRNPLYASLVCAGSDGRNAARRLGRIAAVWGLRPVAESLIV